MRALPLLLLAFAWKARCSAAQGVIATLADLQAAAAAGGSFVVTGALQLNGSRVTVGAGVSLVLGGDIGACGGLCDLDAASRSGHFLVPAGASLDVSGLAFINAQRGAEGTEACDDVLPTQDAFANARLCGAVAVQPGASFTAVDCAWRDNTAGGAGSLDLYGAALSIRVNAVTRLALTRCVFENNVLNTPSATYGGAVSIGQPYGLGNSSAWPDMTPAMTVTFNNCTFQSNAASVGGAVYIQAGFGVFQFLGCSFLQNSATTQGLPLSAVPLGGIPPSLGGALTINSLDESYLLNARYPAYTDHVQHHIVGCTFEDNSATAFTYSASRGGAIFSFPGALPIRIERSVFARNTASQGGAIFYTGMGRLKPRFVPNGFEPIGSLAALTSSSDYYSNGVSDYFSNAAYADVTGYALSVSASAFTNNSAGTQAVSTGGALFVQCGTVEVAGSAFTGNTAPADGGAAYITNACPTLYDDGAATSLVLTNAVFGSNSAGGAGGAVAVADAGAFGDGIVVTAAGVSFSGNAAAAGAALHIACARASVALQNVSVDGNQASEAPGAMYIAEAAAFTVAGGMFSGTQVGVSVANASAVATLTFSGIAVASGGLFFGATAALADCSGVAWASAAAANGTAFLCATAPVRFALSAPPAVRSGAPFTLQVAVLDAYGQVAAAVPGAGLTAAVSCPAAPRALAGRTAAAYLAGAAVFEPLSVSGPPGAALTLAVSVTAPGVPAFAPGAPAAAATLPITLLPCGAGEQYDAALAACACVANAVRNDDGATCTCGATYFWTGAACAACPDGAICAGGVALTAAGRWRASALDNASYDCPASLCAAVPPPAAPGAAPPAAACRQGHTGPLCAVCCAPGAPGCDNTTWAYQGGVCGACDPADAWAAWPRWRRALLLAGASAGGAIALLLLLFLPLLPGLSKSLLVAFEKCRAAAQRLLHRPQLPAQHIGAEAAADARAARRAARKRSLAALKRSAQRAARPLKVVVNFVQVAASFPQTLHVRWPRVFYAIAARLSVVNLSLVKLPVLACMHPEPSFYATFHGYTLGCAAGVAMLALAAAAGAALQLHRGGSLRDKRAYRFFNRCVAAALSLLYFAYPAVCTAVLGVFSCQQLPDGAGGTAWFLRADYREQCYTPRHRAYMAAAAFYVVVYPFGVPFTFWLLLRHYGVARMARAKLDAAWLQAAADWAARHAGGAVPADSGDPRRLTAANVSDEHLHALHTLFCATVSHDDAQPGEAPEAKPAPMQPRDDGDAAMCDGVASKPLRDEAARAAKLRELLAWCRRSELLRIPPLHWPVSARLEEEAERAYAAAAPPIPPTPEEELAEDRVGFLFESYHVECYYWEIIELLRRLLLTAVMSLVSPGSGAQVVMGLLIAFAAVVLYSRRKPYAETSINRLSFVAQVNIFLLLLVALLLKVQVDGADNDSRIYNAVVGTLSLSVLLVPPLNSVIAAFADVDADTLPVPLGQ